MFPGGKGANQAVAAARLGAEVSLIGCVGDDEFGPRMLNSLQREGIDTSHVVTVPGESTGVGCITVAEDGENSIVLAPGANMRVMASHIDCACAMLRDADVILMQLEVPIATIEQLVRRSEDMRALLILNAAPAIALPEEIIQAVDVLIVNETEAAMMVRDRMFVSGGAMGGPHSLIESLGTSGHALAIITRGERGAISCSPGDGVVEHAAFAVETVDTTAAGDAFCAATAVALAESNRHDWNIHEIIRFASAAGGLACTKHGAMPSLPLRTDVQRLMRGMTL